MQSKSNKETNCNKRIGKRKFYNIYTRLKRSQDGSKTAAAHQWVYVHELNELFRREKCVWGTVQVLP